MIAALLTLLASPAGRLGAGLLLAASLCGGVYLKGRGDGRTACLLQGERDVVETIGRADRARAAAERRNLDDGRLRDDDTFRRD